MISDIVVDNLRAVYYDWSMKLTILDGLICGLFVACAAPPEPEGTGCETRVHFSPEAAEVGEAALARINAATGCEVEAADDGVPVELVPAAMDGDKAQCGTTIIERRTRTGEFIRVRNIEVSTDVDYCNSREAVVVHEIFHAMLGTSNVHAEHGVFAEVSGNGESIDESTLMTVCAHMACPVFNPE